MGCLKAAQGQNVQLSMIYNLYINLKLQLQGKCLPHNTFTINVILFDS